MPTTVRPSTPHDRRLRWAVIALATALVALLLPAPAGIAAPWPARIDLPDGFRPEGIATAGTTFYAGSIPTGAIVRGDLRTGAVDELVAAAEGRAAIGLWEHQGVLFVAGGPTGQGYAYDARSGAELAVFALTTESTFVNDVVVTRDAAYFTDSVNQVLYRVPLERGGSFGEPETVPLTGDITYTEGFNANGIAATPDGATLVIVQSNTGQLFTVDAATGVASEIDLGGEAVEMGDGILLAGRDLWVVQNFANLLTLVRLSSDLSTGTVVERFTDAGFDVPTTVARAGNRLALVNARFTTEPTVDTEYWVTQLPRPR